MDQLLELLVIDLKPLFWDRLKKRDRLNIMIINREFYQMLFPRIMSPWCYIFQGCFPLKRLLIIESFLTSNYGKRVIDLNKGLSLSEVLEKWAFNVKKHIEGDVCMLQDRETFWLKDE